MESSTIVCALPIDAGNCCAVLFSKERRIRLSLRMPCAMCTITLLETSECLGGVESGVGRTWVGGETTQLNGGAMQGIKTQLK